MSQKKHRIFRVGVISLFLVLCGSTFVMPQSVSAHHASECSDVFTSLSSFVVNGVNANRSAYETIMNETGVPWEMLAAIHYRETSFSRRNPPNGQGIFQFVNGEGGPYPYTGQDVSEGEFRRQLRFMADRLQNDYVWRGSVPRERRKLQPNEQNIVLVKDTLFSYNGRAGVYRDQAAHFGYNPSLQPYEGSPYVMNRFDCPRARMGLITRDFGSMDGIDTRYGAFTVFSRLRGDSYWRSLSSSPFGDGFVRVKSSDPNDLRQWVLYSNLKQRIPSPEIVFAWGLESTPLVETTSTILDSIANGPPLGRLFQRIGSPDLYLADRGKKYWISSQKIIDAWGGFSGAISHVSGGLWSLPVSSGQLTYSVRTESDPSLYMVDGQQNGQTVLRQYLYPDVHQAFEGDTGSTTLSDELFDTIDDSIGAPLTHTKVSYGGNEYQVSDRKMHPLSSATSSLLPGSAQGVSQQTFKRLTTSSAMTQLVQPDSSPNVYLLDGGQKHRVQSPSVLDAWRGGGAQIIKVKQGFVNLIPDGSIVSSYVAGSDGQLYVMNKGKKSVVPSSLESAFQSAASTFNISTTLRDLYASGAAATGFVKGTNSPRVYLLDNSGNKWHIPSPQRLSLVLGSSAITQVADGYISRVSGDSVLLPYVSDGTTNYVLEGGKKISVSSSTASEWGISSPQTFSDSTLDRFAADGSLSTSIKAGREYYFIRDGYAFATVDSNIAETWSISGAASRGGQVLTHLVPKRMLTRFVVDNNKQFIINNGEWYEVDGNEKNNLSLNGDDPAMKLSPSNAPNAPVDWSSVVVQDGAGRHYVIDGGAKRPLDNAIIKNHWTANGSLNVPTMTNGFLNLLPTAAPIERAIKSNTQAVYSAEGATKRWILSPTTYNTSYAPYSIVSHKLTTVMPQGSDIP